MKLDTRIQSYVSRFVYCTLSKKKRLACFTGFSCTQCLYSCSQIVRCELKFLSVALFLSLAFGGLNTYFFVILFKCRKIFTSFTELTFLHTLSNVPMNECAFRVHQIELMINSAEYFGNRC